MKIIILGAGQVGANLAESLVAENNDITVVDLDTARLAVLQDRFDLRTVRGHAAHPSILKQAGADDADMLVAVTQSDETNLVACRIASTLFNVPTRIARIRSNDFLELDASFLAEHFGVDDVIIRSAEPVAAGEAVGQDGILQERGSAAGCDGAAARHHAGGIESADA